MKPLVFMGRTREDLRAFPKPVKLRVGRELFMLQVGRNPENWKPMASVGPGVREIRIQDASGAFRLLYVATFESAVYVLHAFQKKSQGTARREIELGRRRLRDAMAMEKANHEAKGN